MAFLERTTDVKSLFLNETDLIDRFTGNQLFGWGSNSYGYLGDNTTTARSSPVQTVSGGTNWNQVSSGSNVTAAIKTDGSLWLWGLNSTGSIGDNTTVAKSSPVQTITGGNNWKQTSVGSNQASAIKTDGTLWLWGTNDNGQLGDNTVTNRSSPVQTVSGGTNWKQVSMSALQFGSSSFTAAIKTDGTLWLWGVNTSGQLGDNTTLSRSSPVQTVSGGTNWKQVSVGNNHTAAIKTDGSLWTWGSGGLGQLGDNTTLSKSSPVQTISGGNNWKKISAGNTFSGAIKTDGTLWLWGYNEHGRLGDNTITSRSSPVQTVSGGTNWRQLTVNGVTISGASAFGIKTDGTLWSWGENSSGQLGDNTVTNRSSPVQTITGGTNWRQVEGSGITTVALRLME